MTEAMQKRLEPVILEFTTGDYYPEVYRAKEEFLERAGVVHEDDVEFEQRMNLFMDWYLFDRDLPGVDPVEMGSFIMNEIKKIRFQEKSRHLKLILQLAQMKLKHQRYSHIDVKHIYGFDSKF